MAESNHTETNRNGCEILRSFHGDRERYHYDQTLKGWKQYDTPQDAPYFGVWINYDTRQIFTFCEGDEDLVTAPTQAAFDAELADMAAYYGGA